jgi:hypothetical protein
MSDYEQRGQRHHRQAKHLGSERAEAGVPGKQAMQEHHEAGGWNGQPYTKESLFWGATIPWPNGIGAAEHKPVSAPTPQSPELTVSVGVVNLGSGSPRDQIQEHVGTMVVAWNELLINLTGATEQFVGVVQHSQLRAAEPGFVAALWSRVEPMLAHAAAFVTGTPLGAVFGLEAVKRLIAYGDALEQQRINADQAAFIAQLRSTVSALKQRSPLEGGTVSVNRAVSELDSNFIAVGKNSAEDAYKRGDSGVVGPQATFLKDLQKRAENYASSVPAQESFVTQFLQQWIVAHHQKRRRSALRSPFEDSSYQDGYIEVKISLHYDAAYSGWFVANGALATARLHCPKASGSRKR